MFSNLSWIGRLLDENVLTIKTETFACYLGIRDLNWQEGFDRVNEELEQNQYGQSLAMSSTKWNGEESYTLDFHGWQLKKKRMKKNLKQ